MMAAEAKQPPKGECGEWMCPYRCGCGDFDDITNWLEHMAAEHGVSGPL